MADWIIAAREELAGALAEVESLRYVYKSSPQQFTAPFAVVLPDEPYITLGEKFATYKINMAVQLVVKHSASRTVTIDSLDELIADVLDAIGTEYAISEMESPSVFEVDGSVYLSTVFKTNKIH